jgi:VWFA-related protein
MTKLLSALLPVAALLLGGQAPVVQPGQRPQPGVIRSRIAVIPIDVRVVDRKGNPVTDLKQEDFIVLEDGVPQPIRHFEVQTLVADPRAVAAAADLRAPNGAISAQPRRVFLLVLGRGYMTGPSKELEALQAFVRERLLPQDLVAVLALNRATDFTSDHQAIAGIISRYRELHESIETNMAEWNGGLRGQTGNASVPAIVQKSLDAVFAGADAVRPRELVPGQGVDRDAIKADVRRATDALVRGELTAGRAEGVGGVQTLVDADDARTVDLLGTTLSQHIENTVASNGDVANMYAGIEYMRFIDGEKHLVFITPRGLNLPRLEHDRSIAAAAADSRVAISVLYTAGVVPSATATPTTLNGNGVIVPGRSSPLPTFTATSSQTFNIESLRLLSDISGGHTTAFRYGDVALNRLDLATRSQYLLGYYPPRDMVNGAYRKITVKVKRKDVDVMYRRGYFARDRIVPLDRREFMAFTQMSRAAAYGGADIKALTIRLDGPRVQGSGKTREMLVQVTIGADRIRFEDESGLKVAALDIAIFTGDKDGDPTGEAWQKINLNLNAEAYQKFLREGVTYTARVPLTNYPKHVKAVLYNYTSDLLGTASTIVY